MEACHLVKVRGPHFGFKLFYSVPHLCSTGFTTHGCKWEGATWPIKVAVPHPSGHFEMSSQICWSSFSYTSRQDLVLFLSFCFKNQAEAPRKLAVYLVAQSVHFWHANAELPWATHIQFQVCLHLHKGQKCACSFLTTKKEPRRQDPSPDATLTAWHTCDCGIEKTLNPVHPEFCPSPVPTLTWPSLIDFVTVFHEAC